MEYLMKLQTNQQKLIQAISTFALLFVFLSQNVMAQNKPLVNPGNFGLPGIIDLPTAKKFHDGEIVLTQQLHKYLARSGISFQALPRVGFAFRYSGHGIGGTDAYGRLNHDRSFDAHISLVDEGTYLPAISIGLKDFIGTGWYSSEYIVGTKSIGNLELTAGLGFGRLAGKSTFSNPLGVFSSRFDRRDGKSFGRGGTFGNINWFHGDAASFYGLSYQIEDNIRLLAEYTPDIMYRESGYLDIKSPWNYGISYQFNKFLNFSAQYLHGSQLSVTAGVTVNPERPPLLGGMELAPVPMRLRRQGAISIKSSDESIIKKVLKADQFKIHYLNFEVDTVNIAVTNTKFRSTAQAIGRVASTLQRFTSDEIKFANVSLYHGDLKIASYQVDLEKITSEQFNPKPIEDKAQKIKAVDATTMPFTDDKSRFTWAVTPYIAHRLFNPDLPLSMELGAQFEASYKLATGMKIGGAIRKSVLTNLTDNHRRSDSVLPRVHSDWPLYDHAGQSGHIHALTLSYVSNLAPGLYGRTQVGLLEPFFAGIGGEILYKPAQWPLGIGFDIHHVRKRDYDMLFDFRDYETTVGHISFYYDAGGIFDVEINAGRYLARDWGATTTISRKFGSGWEVGGYATFTDVPFDTFGEGSFDKGFYVSVPLDWITSKPTQAQRALVIRPITRDGGANLASARSLNRHIERSQNTAFQREYGRLWK